LPAFVPPLHSFYCFSVLTRLILSGSHVNLLYVVIFFFIDSLTATNIVQLFASLSFFHKFGFVSTCQLCELLLFKSATSQGDVHDAEASTTFIYCNGRPVARIACPLQQMKALRGAGTCALCGGIGTHPKEGIL
jgi:hypothetical protein